MKSAKNEVELKAEFKSLIERQKLSAEKTLQKFKDSLNVNPVYAFEWADSAVEAAQQLSLCTDLLVSLNNVGIEKTKEWLEKDVLANARWQYQSTSPSSNYAKMMWLKVRADFIETIRWAF